MATVLTQLPLLFAHLPLSIRQMRNAICQLTGPLAKGNDFIVLDEQYLSNFDEVVVIGDVHGCYDELKELLDKLHSETPSRKANKCLKIFVGDLVNKGPKSEKVLELCRDKYPESILSVRGNHDQIVLDQRAMHETRQPLEAKNKWIGSIKPRYISYLSVLPYSIKIPSLKTIVVHAGLDPSLEDPAETTPKNLMLTMRNIIVHKDPKSEAVKYECTKSTQKGACWANFWPGPEHVYFGHDAKRRLQNDHEFATGLDTGCVYGDSLTGIYIKGPKKGTFVSVKAKCAYEPIVDK